MIRALAIGLLCCASTAHAAWTQLDPPADISTWAEITILPAFADTVPVITSTDGFFQANVFWLDFSFAPGFFMTHQRNGLTVYSNITLGVEANAGVHAINVERLGEVFVNSGPDDTRQMFRFTSTAGVREATLNVVQAVPEPSALALIATAGIGLAALRRRR